MATKSETAAGPAFSFETVAVLVAVLKKKGATLGMKDYQLMAELDGNKGAFAFDHMFRKVKAKADVLIASHEGTDTPTKKTKTANGAGSARKKSGGTKRGRYSRDGLFDNRLCSDFSLQPKPRPRN